MAETASVVAAVVVVAGVLAGAPLAALADSPGADGQVAANGTDSANASIEPGERLASVVGVERAAFEGEMASRTFGQRVAAAASNGSRAAVVAAEAEQLRARLDALRAQRTGLREASRNGTLSRGEYRARLARLHAESRALERLADRTARVASGLPAEARRAHGVDVESIRAVRAGAANATGPEAAAIASEMAGPNAGSGFGPVRAGPGGPGNRTGDGGPGNGDGPGGPNGDGGPADRGADGDGNAGPTGGETATDDGGASSQ